MKRLKRRPAFAALLLLLTAVAGSAQNVKYKTLEGKVFGNGNVPLESAIVYLEDSKTNTIRSFISTQDGSYRFGQLSPDIDYQLWARYKSAKSPTRTISSYDSRTQVTIDLHIKTSK